MSCTTCWIGSLRPPGLAWPRRPSGNSPICVLASMRPRPGSLLSARCYSTTTPNGRMPSQPVRISGRWPNSSWSRRRQGAPVARREALPVVRQLSREPDLPVELTGTAVGALPRRVELASLTLSELALERLAQVAEQIHGEQGELAAIRLAVRLRSGTALALAQLHEQMEGGHLDGFLDTLNELRLDALAEPARVVPSVTQARGAEGILVHGAGNMRRSPAARGSGFRLKSA